MNSTQLLQQATICALATPTGGAIGVVRISGEEALTIVDKIWRGKQSLAKMAHATAHLGMVVDHQQEVLDQVVATVWHAPHSYTGENCVELSCHGSAYIMQRLLQTLIKAGCQQAGPGEFTQRAWMHGKMDLSQAEAVADLVSAQSSAAHRVALSQLRGHFAQRLSQLREQLLKLTSLLELEMDFSDHEDLEFASRTQLADLTAQISDEVERLARSFEKGQAIKRGIPVAIVGKTNVGKSTLLNQLLHEERAIVSDIHGTTRDTVEDTMEMGGVMFRFIDTAGIRSTSDTVEQMGIERTWSKIDEATIVLWVMDAPPSRTEEEIMEQRCKGKALLRLWNKADLHLPPKDFHAITISARQGQGMEQLQNSLVESAGLSDWAQIDVVVTSARHYEALTAAHADLQRVAQGLASQLPPDLLSEDLRACLAHLADITGGAITPQDTLKHIFSHFCIGK